MSSAATNSVLVELLVLSFFVVYVLMVDTLLVTGFPPCVP